MILGALASTAFNTPLHKAIMARLIDAQRLAPNFEFVEFVFVF